jgi:hypothetical protein
MGSISDNFPRIFEKILVVVASTHLPTVGKALVLSG